jgi:hypothetical protein
MSSGSEININSFGTYCHETAQLYVSEYFWYYMPASVHKVLVHGANIIEHAVLQIGQLSEESQEQGAENISKKTHQEKF